MNLPISHLAAVLASDTVVQVGAAFASGTTDRTSPEAAKQRLLAIDLLLPARPRRYTRISPFTLQAPRGPQFRLQRSGKIVFKPRVRRLAGFFFPF